jgi:MFS family permease
MRGRVMSLWFVGFQGSTPVGGPIVGWVMEVLGPRTGLGLGAITCFVAAAAGLASLRPGRDSARGRPAVPQTRAA